MKKVSVMMLSTVFLSFSRQIVKAESLTTVNLVTLLDFKPFIWCEDNSARGIDIDILTELFSRVDQSVNIEY